MNGKELCINRIIQGGIYFMNIPELDNKMSPWVVVSKDNGYGANVLVMRITTKYNIKNHILPINMNGNISFIRTSGVKEISYKYVLEGSFEGIIHPDILNIALEMFGRRIFNINENFLDDRLDNYIKSLEEMRLPLKDDISIIFTKDLLMNTDEMIKSISTDIYKLPNISIINDKPKNVQLKKISRHESNNRNILKGEALSENIEYPYKARDWDDKSIIEFLQDIDKLSTYQLKRKYHANDSRLAYLKKCIKYEYEDRKLDIK